MGLNIQTDFTARKFETITVGTTAAVGFTATAIAPTSGNLKNNVCKSAFAVLETNTIRFNYSGGTPTNSIGIPLYAGQDLTLENVDNIKNFKAIADDVTITATDLPILHVTYGF